MTILIRSIGGQGGDTLKELVTHALHYSGYHANSCAKVGLAQRGGSVEAYIEAARTPINFCPHASPHFVDLVMGLELFETYSLVNGGLINRDRTTVITSTSRVYLAQEKMLAGDGTLDHDELLRVIAASSKKLFAIHTESICKEFGFALQAQNIILFAVLPEFPEFGITEDACRHAIHELEKNAEENETIFEITRELIREGGYKKFRAEEPADTLGVVPSRVRVEIYREAHPPTLTQSALSPHRNQELDTIYNEATGRIWNFQRDLRYVRLYRERVEKIIDRLTHRPDFQKNKAHMILAKIMRHLGTMMVYHDASYVAYLKSRRDRLEWVGKETEQKKGEIYHIQESFHPDLMELVGLLPTLLVNYLSAFPVVGGYITEGMVSLPIRTNTTTITGFLTLKALALFRILRLRSWRYKRENRYIELYLKTINEYRNIPYPLLAVLADAPRIIRGYGTIRTASLNTFETFLKSPLPETAEELEKKLSGILKKQD